MRKELEDLVERVRSTTDSETRYVVEAICQLAHSVDKLRRAKT